jgi:hypothetical protein
LTVKIVNPRSKKADEKRESDRQTNAAEPPKIHQDLYTIAENLIHTLIARSFTTIRIDCP